MLNLTMQEEQRRQPHPQQRHQEQAMVYWNDVEEEDMAPGKRLTIVYCFVAFVLVRLLIAAISSGNLQLLIIVLVSLVLGTYMYCHRRRRAAMREQALAAELAAGGRRDRLGRDMLMMQMTTMRRPQQEQPMGVPEEVRARLTRFLFSESLLAAAASDDEESSSMGTEGIRWSEAAAAPHISDPTCSICLGDYAPTDTVVQTPCHHFFHDDCLNGWISMHDVCPLCKQRIAFDADTANAAAVGTTSSPTGNSGPGAAAPGSQPLPGGAGVSAVGEGESGGADRLSDVL